MVDKINRSNGPQKPFPGRPAAHKATTVFLQSLSRSAQALGVKQRPLTGRVTSTSGKNPLALKVEKARRHSL